MVNVMTTQQFEAENEVLCRHQIVHQDGFPAGRDVVLRVQGVGSLPLPGRRQESSP